MYALVANQLLLYLSLNYSNDCVLIKATCMTIVFMYLHVYSYTVSLLLLWSFFHLISLLEMFFYTGVFNNDH